jgi:hypothetical protein
MMRSETYKLRNNIFCAQNQRLEKSVYLFRIWHPKSEQNPC